MSGREGKYPLNFGRGFNLRVAFFQYNAVINRAVASYGREGEQMHSLNFGPDRTLTKE